MAISFARGIRRGFISIVLLTLLSAPAFAQNVGTITGTVKDQQGLAIPGATVSLVNRISQANQNAITDEQGRFTLNNVAYGTYVLNVSLAGFTPASGLVENDRRTPEWDAQYRRAADISYRQLQLLAGPHYGVSWLDNYSLVNELPPSPSSTSERPSLMAGLTTGQEVLQPGEHPFAQAGDRAPKLGEAVGALPRRMRMAGLWRPRSRPMRSSTGAPTEVPGTGSR